MEQCKKILEEQLQLLSEEYKKSEFPDEKLEINNEICRTARTLILADYQTRYGAAGGTRQLSS